MNKRHGVLLLSLMVSAIPCFSQSLVISQIYGGGGSSSTSATYKNDFVELFNPTSADVSLTGWSLQYQAAGSTGAWTNKIPLSGTVLAHHYFFIQTSAPGTGGADFPITPDISSTAISMAAASGKTALVNTTTALSTAPGPPIGCPTTSSGVVDFVGYGSTANCSETARTGTDTTISTAVFRANGGCTDTNDNATDFSIATPLPRNSASTPNTCSGGNNNPSATGSASVNPVIVGNATNLTAVNSPGTTNPPSVSYTDTCDLTAIGGSNPTSLPVNYVVAANTTPNTYSLPCTVTDDQQRTGSFSISLTVSPLPAPTHKIFEITGSGTSSPLAGQSVTVSGIVTGVSSSGFYIESIPADRDADPNTSEGLLIFTSSSKPVCAVVGNQISIQGTVTDFVSSTAAPVGSTPATELGSTSGCQVLATNQLGILPAPVTIDSTTIDPNGSATQARRFAAMRVTMTNAMVTGPSTGNLTENTETATVGNDFWATASGVARPFHTAPGVQATRRPSDAAGSVPSWNGNPEVFDIWTTGLGGSPVEVAVGTVISSISGVVDLDTSSGQYEIILGAGGLGTVTPSTPTLAATPIPAPLPGDLLIAEANIERFYDDVNDNDGDVALTTPAYTRRRSKLSLAVRNVLQMPDIIAIEEAEGQPAGTTATLKVLHDIANQINSDAAGAGQGSPNYGVCGGVTNDIGVISVGFLYRQDHVTLGECTQYGVSTNFNEPGSGNALLNDRPPVMLRATAKAPNSDSGLEVRILVNHLRSLNDIDTPGVANGDRVRSKRNEQAKYVANLITGNLGSEQSSNWVSNSNLLVVGDMNSYQVSDGYVDMVNCMAGSPPPANQIYATAAQLAVSTPCAPVAGLSLTNLTTTDPAQQYSYSFNGIAQRIDHIMVNSPLAGRVRQFAYERNNADFPEGPTYYNDGTRPERYSDHDAPAVYLRLPIEVTSRSRANISTPLYNRFTGRATATLSVTNTGAAALTGPVYIFFSNLPAGVTLPDLPAYNGVPYATVNLPSGLAPGATSSNITVSFGDPGNTRITYATKLFDGTF